MEGCCSASPCLTGQRISICSVASPRLRPRARRRPCSPTDVRGGRSGLDLQSRRGVPGRRLRAPTRASRRRRCAPSPVPPSCPTGSLRDRADVLAGAPALHHLFAVTSGLESIAVGEEEIAGQVRRAYESARETRSTTPELDTAFQRAAKVSRDVRAATSLGKQGRSLVQFALQLAGHPPDGLAADARSDRRHRQLRRDHRRGAAQLSACPSSRSTRSPVAPRSSPSATGCAPEHELRDAIAAAEVVITCTNTYSVTAEDIPDRVAPDDHRPRTAPERRPRGRQAARASSSWISS